jgi:crotonobetainyl-CoA:carnitine CoA-transferase CaiB-like acyl-CoA transferase
MAQPFSGIRVVDFTQVLAGPYATYQMALLGAEVIKVEHPNGGDQGRGLLTPTPESAAAGMSALASAVNSGKRSLSLDLKHEASPTIVDRLVERADVLVENFKAGTMRKLGFGQERIRALNPRLVYCSISGYGQSGPRSHAAAYDPVMPHRTMRRRGLYTTRRSPMATATYGTDRTWITVNVSSAPWLPLRQSIIWSNWLNSHNPRSTPV